MIDFIQAVWAFFNDYVLIASLMVAGVFYLYVFRGLQVRFFLHGIKLLWAKEATYDDDKVNISPLQAFLTGLAARIGMGNIAGVATAIAQGGPGAVFWMWLAAFLGMGTAFVENSLGQLYKTRIGEGQFIGGPAYYIRQGLNSKLFALIFSLVLAFTYGFAFVSLQTNQISDSLNFAYNIPKWVIAALLVFLTTIIIFSSLKTITTVSSIITPIMAILYISVIGVLIVWHFTDIPRVLYTIVSQAFSWDAAAGGGIGAAINYGVKRGLFSNEAGMGSSPNIAASANVKHPVSQGLVQMIGIFFDTIVICSLTAVMVLIAGQYGTGLAGASLAQTSIQFFLDEWGQHFLVILIFLFAFTSVIGYYIYGSVGLTYITENKTCANLYRLAVLFFTGWGAYSTPTLVWDTADIFMTLMCFLNVIAILALWKATMIIYKDYKRQIDLGEAYPEFNIDRYPELRSTLLDPTVWNGRGTPPKDF